MQLKRLGILLALAVNSWAAITVTTAAASSGGSSSTTTALNSAGAVLTVIQANCYTGCVPTVSDALTGCASPCNTYTAVVLYTGNGTANIEFFYAVNPTTGPGHTFTVNGVFATVIAYVVTGTASVSPFDKQNGHGASSAPIQPGSVTPLQNNELVITGVSDSTAGTYTVPSGFTGYIEAGSGVGEVGAGAYQIQTPATAVDPSWATTGASIAVAAAIVTFKAIPTPGQSQWVVF